MINIGIIGSGKVATHLARVLSQNEMPIQAVYSRNEKTGKTLAVTCNAQWFTKPDFTNINHSLDVILICVADDQIANVASELVVKSKTIVAHTSGSISMDVLKNQKLASVGIFYPLQTFSTDRIPDFSEIPILIEGENAHVTSLLTDLANRISNQVRYVHSQDRKTIHLAAVFTNNFTNHLFSISENILKQANLEPNLLYPLAKEGIEKAMSLGAKNAQTGPASRGDEEVMRQQMEMLKNNPEWQSLYKMCSELIQNE